MRDTEVRDPVGCWCRGRTLVTPCPFKDVGTPATSQYVIATETIERIGSSTASNDVVEATSIDSPSTIKRYLENVLAGVVIASVTFAVTSSAKS